MSQKFSADYLHDILEELDDIEAFTVGGKEEFMSDVKTRKAVVRSYEIIGEIAKRLSDDFRETHASINWQQLIRFRDFLAHHYEEILLDNIWLAVTDIPNLRASIMNILDDN